MCRRMGEQMMSFNKAFNNFTMKIFTTVFGDELMIKKVCVVLYEYEGNFNQ